MDVGSKWALLVGALVVAFVVWRLALRRKKGHAPKSGATAPPSADPYVGGSLGGPVAGAPSMNALAPWDPTWTAIPDANRKLLTWGIQTAGRDDLIPWNVVMPEYFTSRQACL